MAARAAATATVCDSVGAGRVPSHANHETAVVSPVGWPPVLAVCHEGMHVALQSLNIELLQLFAVVKRLPERVGLGVVLVQNVEVERLRPPLSWHLGCLGVCAMWHWAFSLGSHDFSCSLQGFWPLYLNLTASLSIPNQCAAMALI